MRKGRCLLGVAVTSVAVLVIVSASTSRPLGQILPISAVVRGTISGHGLALTLNESGLVDIMEGEGRVIATGPTFIGVYREPASDVDQPADCEPAGAVDSKTLSVSVTWYCPHLTVSTVYRADAGAEMVTWQATITYRDKVQVTEERLSWKSPLAAAQVLGRDLALRLVRTGHPYVTDTWTPQATYLSGAQGELAFSSQSSLTGAKTTIAEGGAQVDLILDDYRFHPRYRVKDGTYDRIDMSRTSRASGETVAYSGIIEVGKHRPLLTKERQPDGRLATLVISEHADTQDLSTGQAIAYGKSAATTSALGKGFLGHGLPWTRSVWVETTDRYSATMGLDMPDFLQFSQALARDGVEIVPHTPFPTSRSRTEVLNGLDEYAEFRPRVWIDHSNTRQDLTVFGWDPNSEYFILSDLLDRGYRYFWAYVDLNEVHKGYEYWFIGRDTSVTANMLVPDSTSQIVPILYTDPAYTTKRENGLKPYLWSTVVSWHTRDNADLMAPAAISRLIREGGVQISHHYFSRQRDKQASNLPIYLQRTSDGGWVIDPVFDSYLASIEIAVQRGDLWVPTVGTWADYWVASRQVVIEPGQEASVYRVTNPANVDLKGFSLSVSGGQINSLTVNGHPPTGIRQVSDRTLFWFDLPATGSVDVRLKSW